MSDQLNGDQHLYLGRPLRLDRTMALDFLRRMARERGGMRELRSLYADELRVSALSHFPDELVLEQLAVRIASGALSVQRLWLPEPTVPVLPDESIESAVPPLLVEEESAEQGPAEEKEEKKKTSIEFIVLWGDSGEPLPSIELIVTLPSGDEKKLKTDDKGSILLENIDDGAFGVRSELGEAGREETLILVGMGSPDADPPTEGEENGAADKKTYRIASAAKHKVRTGETLENLAKQVGMSWQNLAKFNWGTDEPKKINRSLRHDVGCTKRDAKGNYIFDDSDEPGIIVLPKPWVEEGLSGGKHVIQVVQASQKKKWLFSL